MLAAPQPWSRPKRQLPQGQESTACRAEPGLGRQRAEDPSTDLGTAQPQGRLRVSCPKCGTKPWGPRLVSTRPPATAIASPGWQQPPR